MKKIYLGLFFAWMSLLAFEGISFAGQLCEFEEATNTLHIDWYYQNHSGVGRRLFGCCQCSDAGLYTLTSMVLQELVNTCVEQLTGKQSISPQSLEQTIQSLKTTERFIGAEEIHVFRSSGFIQYSDKEIKIDALVQSYQNAGIGLRIDRE